MRLEFKQKNKKEVLIIAVKGKVRKEVGKIYTPAGSSHDTINAIQICGFKEAYDLWGCAVYARVEDKESVIARLESREKPIIQNKDIQLLFSWDTIPHNTEHHDIGSDCCRCYNKPCTCDIKVGDVKGGNANHPDLFKENPYKVKRCEDVEVKYGYKKKSSS